MMTSTSSEPNDSGNSNNDTSVTTILTNPGIIDRLEQDIDDYLSPFGFHLERQQQHEQEDGERSGNCRAVLTIPRLPYTYSYNNIITPHERMMKDGGASRSSSTSTTTNIITTTTEAAEGCACGPTATPIGTLHLHIHQESLLSTVGPLLRTFLRLSPSHISPRRLRAIIHCDEHYFVLDALQKLAKMNAEQRCHQLNRQEEISARKMAHYIHMLVRNSMGAALCLELVVVLPCYWMRTLSVLQNGEGEEGGNTINAKGATITSGSKVPISVETVQLEMQNNPDACYYPSVQLVEAAATTTNNKDEEQPSNRSNSDDNDDNPTSIHLDVQTRMCTVRHQPLIFQWLHSLSSMHNDEGVDECKHADVHVATTTDCGDPYSTKAKDATPVIMACIQKVGNLHRILMLCHDYDKVDPNRCKCNDSGKEDDTAQSIQSSYMISNLIVIIPNANPDDAKDEQQPDKLLRDFEEAVDHFHKVIINPNGDKNELCHRPTFVYENEAAEQIPLIVEQRQAQTMQSTASNYQHSLVGIDLHPDALTLQGDYATTSSTEHTVSPALRLMRDADAIVFGYESSGIPDTVANQLNGWVQIPSRSSINVVAAMSIIQDALFGAGAQC